MWVLILLYFHLAYYQAMQEFHHLGMSKDRLGYRCPGKYSGIRLAKSRSLCQLDVFRQARLRIVGTNLTL